MHSCRHNNLLQLPEAGKKLKCTHCHLVINENELNGGYCPECFEINGDKRYNFETQEVEKSTITKYKCEDCGVIIESK